jgi:hypothetical protein
MKKIGFLTLLITASLLLTLSFSAAAAGPKASAAPVPAVAPAPAPAAAPAMRNAREHLAHAEGDFHGHREKALEHLDKAIHQAEECER